MVDLTDCDREPIHIPGTIQPHGVLLVLLEPDLTLAQVSDNLHEYLGLSVETALGGPLSSVMDAASVEAVRKALSEQSRYDPTPLPIRANGREFDGIVHRHDGATILELEPTRGAPAGTYHPLRSALVRIQRVDTLADLADVVVNAMQRVTGFERVMLYRFHEDGHGSVEAEARLPELEPFLGLHYPASDIPAQARRLYLQNWFRLIADARARPARVVPTLRLDTGGPLDLSFSVLRSVSPIHLEYMANMGVYASMSVSLVVKGQLWGLISCLDHSGPRHVSHELRAACEFVGRLTSMQIAALQDRELLAGRASRLATAEVLAGTMREHIAQTCVLSTLLAHPEELMGLVGAGGAAVVSDGGARTAGRTPPPEIIKEIATWVEDREAVQPFSTASLAEVFPEAAKASEVASGLLTFALPGSPSRRLLWFRPEIITTVSWGGDPSKPIAEPNGGRLRPRHSFAVWREQVRRRSHPWTPSDLDAAEALQRRAIMVDLERRLSSERRAVQARDDLLAVVSHDLRSPLSAIQMQAEAMLISTADGEASPGPWLDGARLIRSSAVRMGELIEDLLDLEKIEARRFTLDLRSVECRAIIEEALLAASPLAENKRITLAIESIDPLVLNVDPKQILRVLSNLIGNAIKFTPEGGSVTVRAERQGGECQITVRDTGPGLAAEHLSHVFDRYWKGRPAGQGSGLGLDIAKGIVEEHGGRIWAESSPDGARLSFTVPLAR